MTYLKRFNFVYVLLTGCVSLIIGSYIINYVIFKNIVDEVKKYNNLELFNVDIESQFLFFEATIFLIGGLILGLIFIVVHLLHKEISHRKDREKETFILAHYDPLTGLANRRILNEKLDQIIERSSKSKVFNNYSAIIMIDLDKFKTLNDTKGHDYGDDLLINVAKRLTNVVREVDVVCRLGGDEFIVLIDQLKMKEDLAKKTVRTISEKILSAISSPFNILDEKGYKISGSIGVNRFIHTTETPDQLIKKADLALYKAKRDGRNNIQYYHDLSIEENMVPLDLDLSNELVYLGESR